jgi:hypothetical protein
LHREHREYGDDQRHTLTNFGPALTLIPGRNSEDAADLYVEVAHKSQGPGVSHFAADIRPISIVGAEYLWRLRIWYRNVGHYSSPSLYDQKGGVQQYLNPGASADA